MPKTKDNFNFEVRATRTASTAVPKLTRREAVILLKCFVPLLPSGALRSELYGTKNLGRIEAQCAALRAKLRAIAERKTS